MAEEVLRGLALLVLARHDADLELEALHSFDGSHHQHGVQDKVVLEGLPREMVDDLDVHRHFRLLQLGCLSRLLLLFGPLPRRGLSVHLEGVVLVELACRLLLFDSLRLFHLVERGKTAVPAAQTHAQFFVLFVLVLVLGHLLSLPLLRPRLLLLLRRLLLLASGRRLLRRLHRRGLGALVVAGVVASLFLLLLCAHVFLARLGLRLLQLLALLLAQTHLVRVALLRGRDLRLQLRRSGRASSLGPNRAAEPVAVDELLGAADRAGCLRGSADRRRNRGRGCLAVGASTVVELVLNPPLALVCRHVLLVHAEEDAGTHLQLRGRQEVLLAADHEGSRRQVLARHRRLRHLVVVHPPGRDHDAACPSVRAAHSHVARLVQRVRGHTFAARVLDDCGRCAVHVSVHVDVALLQVTLHENLVLLRVASRHDQVVLRGDEPVELLEPQHLPHVLEVLLGHELLLLSLRGRLARRRLHRLPFGSLRLHLLLVDLLLDLEEGPRVCVRRHRDVDVDNVALRRVVRIVGLARQEQRHLVLVQLQLVDDRRNGVAQVLLLLHNPRQLSPVDGLPDGRTQHDQHRLNLFRVLDDKLRVQLVARLLLLQPVEPLPVVGHRLVQLAHHLLLRLDVVCLDLPLVERAEVVVARVVERRKLLRLQPFALVLLVQHGRKVLVQVRVRPPRSLLARAQPPDQKPLLLGHVLQEQIRLRERRQQLVCRRPAQVGRRRLLEVGPQAGLEQTVLHEGGAVLGGVGEPRLQAHRAFACLHLLEDLLHALQRHGAEQLHVVGGVRRPHRVACVFGGVRAHQGEDLVRRVAEDQVALGVELDDETEAGLVGAAERKLHHTVHAQLTQGRQAPLTDVLPDLQGEAGRHLRLVELEGGRVDAAAHLNDDKVLLVSVASAELQQVRLRVDVVDVHKTLPDKTVAQLGHCCTQVHRGHARLPHCMRGISNKVNEVQIL
eukprot:Rhum_TRINITY_DN21258_c0_g1::Rhum_TRINITY_DN21258_c0_g1_i1::g.173594::m.173594